MTALAEHGTVHSAPASRGDGGRAREVADRAIEAMTSSDATTTSIVAGAVAHVAAIDDDAQGALDAFLDAAAPADAADVLRLALAALLESDALALAHVSRALDAALRRSAMASLVTPGRPPRFDHLLEHASSLPSRPVGGDPWRQDAAGYRAFPLLCPVAEDPDAEFLLRPRQSFDLAVGLSPFATHAANVAASLRGLGTVTEGMTVQVHLSYDPESFSVDAADGPITLLPTAAEPFPVATVTVTPLPTARPLVDRRIAAHYVVDGAVRAIAFLALRDAAAARAPRPASPALVDLTPLVDEQAPDVVVAIYGADAASPGTYTIAAFPRDPAIAPPGVGRVDIGPEAAQFMRQMFRVGNGGSDPVGVYDTLAGIGWQIGKKIPPQILATLRQVAESAPPDAAATMLLVTEEAAVPWELAAFGGERGIASPSGGGSPYLGAHFAIGRWPIVASEVTPPMPDARRVDVHRTALVRADYEGVGDGWRPLPGASAEVDALERSYTPSTVWSPLIDDVKEALFTDVDVIHFALHGQVDTSPSESGLVLLRRDGEKVRPAYLSAHEILGLITQDRVPLPSAPFIFLNACQVGQGDELLGDYAGMAAALLEAGARAVVACIWNVNDGVAGSISTEFYERADRGEAPAEILREVRTRYRRPDPGDRQTPSVPTLIAYQYFGHPGMRVVRTG